VVGNTNVTVDHLNVQFEHRLHRLFSVIWRLEFLKLKVTNLENVHCTGLLHHFFDCCNGL
jgi:hypothetical protein